MFDKPKFVICRYCDGRGQTQSASIHIKLTIDDVGEIEASYCPPCWNEEISTQHLKTWEGFVRDDATDASCVPWWCCKGHSTPRS